METQTGTWPSFSNMLGCLNKRDHGIFCLVNESSDFTRRRKQDICRVRAVWADFDGAGELPKLPMEPSLVVQTRSGYHVYYILKDRVGGIMWGESMNRHIARKYGADPRACDAARVLRVPGFYHHKGDPYLVTLLANTGKRYTPKDLEAALGAPERPQEATWAKTAAPPLLSPQDTAWGVAAALDEKRKVGATPDGGRNHQLATSAFKLGQIVGMGKLTEYSAELALLRGARENGYAEEEGDTSTMQTIRSGLREGAKRPRRA